MTWFWSKTRSKDVQELWDAIRTLTRTIEAKDLDWADMRARCKRLLDRTEKAATRAEVVVESGLEVPTKSGEGNNHAGRFLSPHQLEIQQAVLKRRGGV